MSWEEVGEEMFINPQAPQRAMETSYPYALTENLNIGAIDRVVVRLKLPYALTSRWHKLARKILRMDTIDTNLSYVW